MEMKFRGDGKYLATSGEYDFISNHMIVSIIPTEKMLELFRFVELMMEKSASEREEK